MYFEVVTKNTPKEGVRYHARIRTDEHSVLFWSADYSLKRGAYAAIEMVQADVDGAPIYEVTE
jgi:uncharacterized protein YegP (UPF0339 family)